MPLSPTPIPTPPSPSLSSTTRTPPPPFTTHSIMIPTISPPESTTATLTSTSIPTPPNNSSPCTSSSSSHASAKRPFRRYWCYPQSRRCPAAHPPTRPSSRSSSPYPRSARPPHHAPWAPPSPPPSQYSSYAPADHDADVGAPGTRRCRHRKSGYRNPQPPGEVTRHHPGAQRNHPRRSQAIHHRWGTARVSIGATARHGNHRTPSQQRYP